MKRWNRLTNFALLADGTVGYMQLIGKKAIPRQVVDKNPTTDFGVGTFLLAASEMCRFVE